MANQGQEIDLGQPAPPGGAPLPIDGAQLMAGFGLAYDPAQAAQLEQLAQIGLGIGLAWQEQIVADGGGQDLVQLQQAIQAGLAGAAPAPAQPQNPANIIARATTSLYHQGAGQQNFAPHGDFLLLIHREIQIVAGNLPILAGILGVGDTQWLLAPPADINAVIGNNNNLTPLTAAAMFGRFGVVQQMLLENPTQENLDTALYNALQFGHLRVTQALMEKGARLSSEAAAQLFGGNWLFWYRAGLKEPLQKVLKAMTRDYKAETASYKWAIYAMALPLLTTGFILHLEHAPWILSLSFLAVGMGCGMIAAYFFSDLVFKPVSKMSRFSEIPAIEQNPDHISPERLDALLKEEANRWEEIPVYSLKITLLFSVLATTEIFSLMARGQYPGNHFHCSSMGIQLCALLALFALVFLLADAYRFIKQRQSLPPAAEPQQPVARGTSPVSSPYNRFSFFGRCAGLGGLGALGLSGFDMALSFQIAAGFWAVGFFISNVLPELHALVTVGLPTERDAKVRTQKQCALALASFGALGLMGTLTAPGLFHLSLSINNTVPLIASTALFSAIVLAAMGLALYYKHKEQHLNEEAQAPLLGH